MSYEMERINYINNLIKKRNMIINQFIWINVPSFPKFFGKFFLFSEIHFLKENNSEIKNRKISEINFSEL